MNVTKNGITISIDDSEVIRLALQRLNEDVKNISPVPQPFFRIGEQYYDYGGVYAGITRTADRTYEYHLFVGPEADNEMNWDAAVDWAKKAVVGNYSDFALPLRNEQALMFANVPELFKKEAYWSGEQHAGSSSGAWLQYFGNGTQSYWSKHYHLRVRAVRRLTIQ